MMEWRDDDFLSQEAERQKAPEPLPIRTDYWPEAILFIGAALFGGLIWWVIS